MEKFLGVVLALILCFGIALLWWGFIAWAICALLKAIGIVTIGGWTVGFSWKLAILLALISSIFSTRVVANK